MHIECGRSRICGPQMVQILAVPPHPNTQSPQKGPSWTPNPGIRAINGVNSIPFTRPSNTHHIHGIYTWPLNISAIEHLQAIHISQSHDPSGTAIGLLRNGQGWSQRGHLIGKYSIHTWHFLSGCPGVGDLFT